MTDKGPFVWTNEQQQAFDVMKAMMIRDCLLCYPDHNKGFQISTDASNYQLGAIIMQDGAPVAYYSQKLKKSQQNYTTMEKELPSIYEPLKEF
jgi:hypothetical protein